MTTSAGSRGSGVGSAEAGARRSRSVVERQRIVDAALAPGASVAGVARANGVNANLVFKWIRRSREGWRDRRCGADKRLSMQSSSKGLESPTFVPVRLIETDRAAAKLAPARVRESKQASALGAAAEDFDDRRSACVPRQSQMSDAHRRSSRIEPCECEL